MDEESKPDADERPPICPASGVTMGIEDGATRYACLECGFSDDDPPFTEGEASHAEK